MTSQPPPIPLLTLSEQVYRALLVLYPADFRRDYGQHMTQVFRDVCRDAYRQGGAWGLAGWWAAALFDLLQSVIAERRKVNLTMSQAKFVQLTGWLCILGGVFFAVGSISQFLRMGSQTYQVLIAALVPGTMLITLGLLGIALRYFAHINLFGKLALMTALGGAVIATLGILLMIAMSDYYWGVFIVGWLLYLIGHTVFGGFATTIHLLPKWNFALLIGSAFPLTLVVLSLSGQQAGSGTDWGTFFMLILIGAGWIVTGLALNSKPAPLAQAVAGA